jgi:hypothetical protein
MTIWAYVVGECKIIYSCDSDSYLVGSKSLQSKETVVDMDRY